MGPANVTKLRSISIIRKLQCNILRNDIKNFVCGMRECKNASSLTINEYNTEAINHMVSGLHSKEYLNRRLEKMY